MRASTRVLASLSLCAVAAMLGGALVTQNVAAAGNGSANLDQCANGPLSAPVPCTGGAWQNGNANASSAHWSEGESIAYRLKFGGLTPGSTHQVTIEWDTTKGGKHAYDFLTTWDWSEDWLTPADRCQAPVGSGTIPGCETAGETVAYTRSANPLVTSITSATRSSSGVGWGTRAEAGPIRDRQVEQRPRPPQSEACGMPAERLAYQLADSGARLMLTTAALAEFAAEALGDKGAVFTFDGGQGWDALFAEPLSTPHRSEDDETAALFYTSGTTGSPKAVPLTHRNIGLNLEAIGAMGLVRPGDRVLLPLPLVSIRIPILTGTSSCENELMVCAMPSSKTLKFSFLSPLTKCPLLS